MVKKSVWMTGITCVPIGVLPLADTIVGGLQYTSDRVGNGGSAQL